MSIGWGLRESSPHTPMSVELSRRRGLLICKQDSKSTSAMSRSNPDRTPQARIDNLGFAIETAGVTDAFALTAHQRRSL